MVNMGCVAFYQLRGLIVMGVGLKEVALTSVINCLA